MDPGILGDGERGGRRGGHERLVEGGRDPLRHRADRAQSADRRPPPLGAPRRRPASAGDRYGSRTGWHADGRQPDRCPPRRPPARLRHRRRRPGRHPVHVRHHRPAPGRHTDTPQLLRLPELRLHDRGPAVPAVPGRDDGRRRAHPGVQPAVPCVGPARLRGDGSRRRLQPFVDHRPLRRREDPAPHRGARHRPLVGSHHPGLEAGGAPSAARLRRVVGDQHRRRRVDVVSRAAGDHAEPPCPMPAPA